MSGCSVSESPRKAFLISCAAPTSAPRFVRRCLAAAAPIGNGEPQWEESNRLHQLLVVAITLLRSAERLQKVTRS